MASELYLYAAAAGAAFALILAIVALAMALAARARIRRLAASFEAFEAAVRDVDARLEENQATLMRIRAFQAPGRPPRSEPGQKSG